MMNQEATALPQSQPRASISLVDFSRAAGERDVAPVGRATRVQEFALCMLRIRRVEFLVAEIPIIALPLLVTLRESASLRSSVTWEGVVLFFLLFNFGDMINCLADRDLDATYKPHLSRAVYGLGLPFVRGQIAVTALAAIGVASHLSITLHRWTIVPLVLIGLLLGAAYSVKPMQLKGRGLGQVLCLWLIIFVGPMMLISVCQPSGSVTSDAGGLGIGMLLELPSLAVMSLAATYGALQMGVILVNTAEDFPEDRAASIRTTIVALGLRRGIRLAFGLVILGGLGVMASFVTLYVLRAVPPHGFLAFIPLLVALGWVASEIGRLRRNVDRSSSDEDGARIVKRAAKRVPIWITAGAWTAFGTALTLFFLQR